ncbi:unnamed protein product, partial [Prorocentrum cordatum]
RRRVEAAGRPAAAREAELGRERGRAAVAARGAGQRAKEYTAEQWREFRKFESRWWYHELEYYFHFGPEDEARALEVLGAHASELGGGSVGSGAAEGAGAAALERAPPEVRALCRLVDEVVPRLRPAHLGTVLVGFDSLAVARLAYSIKARLGKVISIAALREARTVDDLAAAVAPLEDLRSAAPQAADDVGQEYAVWFSPGQYVPMGAWVLRSDEPIDVAAMESAVRGLVDRHSALRAGLVDPLRYMSVLYDASTLWTLYAPLLLTSGLPFVGLLRRLVSWALWRCWPRIRCHDREQVYAERYPEARTPFQVVHRDAHGRPLRGQLQVERTIKSRARGLKLPIEISVVEVACHLVDVWCWEAREYPKLTAGRATIVRRTGEPIVHDGSDLVYVSAGGLGPQEAGSMLRWSAQGLPNHLLRAQFMDLQAVQTFDHALFARQATGTQDFASAVAAYSAKSCGGAGARAFTLLPTMPEHGGRTVRTNPVTGLFGAMHEPDQRHAITCETGSTCTARNDSIRDLLMRWLARRVPGLVRTEQTVPQWLRWRRHPATGQERLEPAMLDVEWGDQGAWHVVDVAVRNPASSEPREERARAVHAGLAAEGAARGKQLRCPPGPTTPPWTPFAVETGGPSGQAAKQLVLDRLGHRKGEACASADATATL